MASTEIIAEFDQHRNDIYWKVWAGEDKFVRWTGYDDRNWWDNVSPTDHFRRRVGSVTGRVFRLDPHSNTVTVEAAPARQQAAQ